jgi:hypothetical protein
MVLQILEETLKVSLFADRVSRIIDYLRFAHQVLTLTNSTDNPSQTPLSHMELDGR